MTAVKSLSQIRHLAENRLPVSGADVMRLVEENERLREALEDILKANDWYMSDCPMNDPDPVTEACARARAALRSEGEEA